MKYSDLKDWNATRELQQWFIEHYPCMYAYIDDAVITLKKQERYSDALWIIVHSTSGSSLKKYLLPLAEDVLSILQKNYTHHIHYRFNGDDILHFRELEEGILIAKALLAIPEDCALRCALSGKIKEIEKSRSYLFLKESHRAAYPATFKVVFAILLLQCSSNTSKVADNEHVDSLLRLYIDCMVAAAARDYKSISKTRIYAAKKRKEVSIMVIDRGLEILK